jgi:hypothetical protein
MGIYIPLSNQTSKIALHKVHHTDSHSGHHRGHTLGTHASYQSKFISNSITFTRYIFHLGNIKFSASSSFNSCTTPPSTWQSETITKESFYYLGCISLQHNLANAQSHCSFHPLDTCSQLHMHIRLLAVDTLKRYSKALEYEYRVKTAALGTLKRYSILSLTLYLE